jgi:hypothetical protein
VAQDAQAKIEQYMQATLKVDQDGHDLPGKKE